MNRTARRLRDSFLAHPGLVFGRKHFVDAIDGDARFCCDAECLVNHTPVSRFFAADEPIFDRLAAVGVRE